MFQRFGYGILFFHLFLKTTLFLPCFVLCEPLFIESIFFIFHKSAYFLCFLLCLISSFLGQSSSNMACNDFRSPYYFVKVPLLATMWSIFKKVPFAAEKNVHSIVIQWNKRRYPLSPLLLLFFHLWFIFVSLSDQSTCHSGIMRSYITILAMIIWFYIHYWLFEKVVMLFDALLWGCLVFDCHLNQYVTIFVLFVQFYLKFSVSINRLRWLHLLFFQVSIMRDIIFHWLISFWVKCLL